MVRVNRLLSETGADPQGQTLALLFVAVLLSQGVMARLPGCERLITRMDSRRSREREPGQGPEQTRIPFFLDDRNNICLT